MTSRQPLGDDHTPFDLHPEARGEVARRARRWGQAAAAGWALSCVLGAMLLIVLARPSLVPGYGPNSDLLESQWSDFAFRYPDAQAALLESPGAHTVEGGVVWSEQSQRGMIRFQSLPPPERFFSAVENPQSDDGHASEAWVYQIWLITGAGDPLIGAGTFDLHDALAHPHAEDESPASRDSEAVAEGPHSGAGLGHEISELIVPFEPGVSASGVTGVLVTVEPAGGVWVSDRSRVVARGVLRGEATPATPMTDDPQGH